MNSNVEHQLDVYEKKRHLLCSLIRISKDIYGHTHSLGDALLLAKPSQIYPQRVQEYKKQIDHYFLLLNEADLLIRSKNYDNQSSVTLDTLLEFMNLTELQVTEENEPEAFNIEAREQLKEFGSVTKIAVVLRLLLQDLGVMQKPVKFSIPQEMIGEQISQLNDTNHQLRLKTTDKIAEVIADIVELMDNPNLPEPMYNTLDYVQHAMKENLEHLEHGGDIEKLPIEFEDLELTAIPQAEITQYREQKHQKETLTVDAEQDKKKMSFNTKLKLWLNTPWEKRWRDLD